MNLDTPLAEVAHLLSEEAVLMLETIPMNRQMGILGCVRRLIVYWEQDGVMVDPMTLGVVLNGVVREMIAILQAAIDLAVGAIESEVEDEQP